MSIADKSSEIRRLIDAFAAEADKFHNITFTMFEIANGIELPDEKFLPQNHAIMLWQYYGLVRSEQCSKLLLNNLSESDLKWGIKGSSYSVFAVIEGVSAQLFVRMAKRAGNIFSNKEASDINMRFVNNLVELKQQEDPSGKHIFVANSNPLAVWLNYLLFHISVTNPGREKSRRIEPDPFTLSLVALERLIEDRGIGTADRSTTSLENIHFRVAVSFPGEYRKYVSQVVAIIRNKLGCDAIFYDYDYQAQLARPNLDILLQKIYKENTDLVVVFICSEYAEKQWCGLEWRAIRELIKDKADDKIMFIRFDDSRIDGVFSIDGYIDARFKEAKDVARLILNRIACV